MKSLVQRSALAVCFLFACDGGEKKPTKDGGKAADAKANKGKDATKAEAKAGDDKAAAKPAEKHFDISHDKSGVLARSAAALEAVESIDSENLRELSHHAEKLPSLEKVCKHIASIRGADFDETKCVKDYEHHVVRIGPELYGEVAKCELDAKTVAELDVCDAAEAEAEKLLHEKPHGEGLDGETCGKFFVKFEELAIADAGENGELVKEVLEEVKPDVLEACADQGSKAEIECGMKSKTLTELRECASALI
ncbi:MAG: hypothetical protein AAF721_23220 [Myxococcota bacterium]